MFKRILVPLDGSVRAEAALTSGIELAKQFQGALTLLRAVELMPDGISGSDVIDRIRDEQLATARTYLERAAQRASQSGVKAETVAVPGDAARVILSFARDQQTDVIVINSHGSGGLTGYVFGSVAEKIVRGAGCPVLVMHERPTAEELREQEEREEAEFDAVLASSLARGAR